MNNLTIRTKLILLMVVSIILGAFLYITNIINSHEKQLTKYIQNIKIEAYANKKEELLHYSDLAHNIITFYYEKTLQNKKLTPQMQKEALLAIKNMRYGKNGYFWINDMDNKMLMHPIKPEYDNKYFINTPKVPFVLLGTQKLNEVQKDIAFIEYSFYTPATKKYSHKLSVVNKFKPWDWVIGTGAYTDYLEAKIAHEKKVALEEIQTKIKNIIIIAIILLLILLIIMIKLMEKIIINPLNNFQKGLNQFFKYLEDENIVVEKLKDDSNDEIGMMSKKTNIAIESAIKTHDELLSLRKQLEQQVETTTQNLDKTKKEFDTISQDTHESLEYGALIQSSILPEEKTIKSAFSNYFIMDVQKDIINSQFYLFEKLKTNEFLYVIIDCKKDGIQGVFTTMLINAIVKQAITQLKYDDSAQVDTSWILEYLNQNIEMSINGFDGAIVYYNKNTNELQYSGANLPFHYYQDESFHIIKPDTTAIAVDKDTKYTQHTIEIKEYLEFYISTHHYIKDFINAYEFTSPFLSEENQFKEYLPQVETDIVVSGFQIDNKPKVIIEYEGEFTQQAANNYIELIEDKISNMGLMSNISTNFVEQYQNILHYAKSPDETISQVTPYGTIKLQKNPDDTYSIESVNVITLADKQKIEPKLFEIQSLDRNGIRKKYRELRKSGAGTHEKGGGIGFYEIAKRCLRIEYDFKQLNQDRFEFRFISVIGSDKK